MLLGDKCKLDKTLTDLEFLQALDKANTEGDFATNLSIENFTLILEILYHVFQKHPEALSTFIEVRPRTLKSAVFIQESLSDGIQDSKLLNFMSNLKGWSLGGIIEAYDRNKQKDPSNKLPEPVNASLANYDYPSTISDCCSRCGRSNNSDKNDDEYIARSRPIKSSRHYSK